MNPSPATTIRLLADDSPAAHRWRAWLEAAGCRVLGGGDAESPADAVWVVAGDWPQDTLFPEWPNGGEHGGLVRIGGTNPADAQLPCDVTARELVQACRLVAEIARLRRQVRHAVDVRRHWLQQALTDPLTGLPNRRAWDETLAGAWKTLGEKTATRCLAVLDLDHFKQVNDHFGHPAGDAVLRDVGRALRDGLRQDDFLARLGGDEFGLLLPVPDPTTAQSIVERVRRSTCRVPLPDGTPITASAGLCLIPTTPPLPCPAESLAAADAALLEAKRAGRDRLQVAGNREQGTGERQ